MTGPFPDDVLAENRAGRLTRAQRRQSLVTGLLMAVFAVGAVAVAIFLAIPCPFCGQRTLPAFEMWVGDGIAVLLALGLGWGAWRALQDPFRGIAASIEGEVTKDQCSRGERCHSYLVVDGKRFTATTDQLLRILVGARYRVYYAPGTDTVASFERV